jgi:hypothetical protein
METVQQITCCCDALARQRYIFGKPIVEPKEISTASVRDLSLYKSHKDNESVLLNV